MNREFKIGEQLILYGKIKKFNELLGEYEYAPDISAWQIQASVRDENVNGIIVGSFIRQPSPLDAYFLTMDTSGITSSEKIVMDIRFSPPLGLPGFSKTYTYFVQKSVTPP